MTFVCDVCSHRKSGGEPPACLVCVRGGGAMRELNNGNWVHVSCVSMHPNLSWNVTGKQVTCKPSKLCPRRSGCARCLSNDMKVEVQLQKPSGHNAHCAVANCPDSYGKAKYLVTCGGCSTRATRERHRMAHISCAQAAGSGWHVQWKSGVDDKFSVEILCPGCHDCELDMDDERPRYRFKAPCDETATLSLVSDDDYASALWTFQDWAHGPCGGFHFVSKRLGGLCTGACDNSAKWGTRIFEPAGCNLRNPQHSAPVLSGLGPSTRRLSTVRLR